MNVRSAIPPPELRSLLPLGSGLVRSTRNVKSGIEGAPMDSFENHPKSITELRAEKAHSGREWTPRDALIAALRDVDSGDLKAEALFIACSYNDGKTVRYYNASPNRVAAIGTIEIAKQGFLDDSD